MLARNWSSKGEEKVRVFGGWGRRPREIAGEREVGGRPGARRSQPFGLRTGGLGGFGAWVHRCGAQMKWGRRREALSSYPHARAPWGEGHHNLRLFT